MSDTTFSGVAAAKVRRDRVRPALATERPNALLRLTYSDFGVMALFFLLLYVEPITLGTLKVSVLWKGALALLLSMLLIRRHMPLWFVLALLYTIKCFIYTTVPYGLMQNISLMMEFYFFAVLVLYFYRTTTRHADWHDRMIILSLKVALFFIFTTLPFIAGLESLNPARDLSMWGLDGNAVTGFFYSLSPAAKVYFTAALVLLAGYRWFPRNTRYQLIYWLGAALGAYLVYASFTRTGWITYAGGVLLMALYQQGASRKLFAITLLTLVAVVAGIYLLENQAFILRLAGGAVGYRENVEVSLEALLRSRMPFIFTAIENLNDNGFPAWVLGHGVQEGIDMFKVKTGLAIQSHNGTTNTLEAVGLLGLFVYFLFCALIGKALWVASRIDPGARSMYVITAYLWAATFLISHGLPFYAQFVLIGPVVRALLIVQQRRFETIVAKARTQVPNTRSK